MKRIKITLSAILFLGFGLTEVRAQESANASGGDIAGSGGSVSYSVGQIVYTTNTGTTGVVTQGVQQPYEISIVTSTENNSGISLSFSVHPNPTTHFLMLNVGGNKIERLSFNLYDISGRLIDSKELIDNETMISMGSYSSGIYFLKIIESNNELKIFKIIKN